MGMGGGGGRGGGGGGFNMSTTSFNGTSTVTPPGEVLDMYRSINPRAQAAANTPWENYSDTPEGFVAQLNDTQRGGMAGIMNNIFGGQNDVANGLGAIGQGVTAYNNATGMANYAGNQTVSDNNIAGISDPYYGNAANYTNAAINGPGGLDAANGYLGAGAALAGYGGQGTNQVGSPEISQYLSPFQSNVIDPTMKLLGQQNEQAMSGALGNIIKGGGMGNDRAGVMMANQNQQNTLANAKVLGDLQNANYSQALNTAVGQRAQNQADLQRAIQSGQTLAQVGQTAGGLRQQDLQRQLTGAQQLAGIGTAKRGAYETQQQQRANDLARQLSGAGTLGQLGAGLGGIGQTQAQTGMAGNQNLMSNYEKQIQAGTLDQQTTQAGKDAMYNQWQQKKAYPFMTTQWLADIYGGLGPLYGSTTNQSGTATTMGWSDPRLKSGVGERRNYRDGGSADHPEVVGKTFDDQPIYRYSLMGGPAQLGLMADEAAQRNPDAVHNLGGLLAMDYAKATDQAADIGHEIHANHRSKHAGGGSIADALHSMAQLYGNKKPGQAGPGGSGYVPQSKGAHGQMLQPHSMNIPKPELPQRQPDQRHAPPDMAGMIGQMKGLAGLGGKGGLGSLGSMFSGAGGAFDTAAATSAAVPATAVADNAAPAAEEFPKAIPASTDSAPLPPTRPSDLSTADLGSSSDYADLGSLYDLSRYFAKNGGRIERGIGGIMPFNTSKGKIPFAPNGGSMPFEQGMAHNVVPASVMNDQHHPKMLQSDPPDMMKMAQSGKQGGQGGGQGGGGGGDGGMKQAEQFMKMGLDQMKGMSNKGQAFANSAPTKITDAATQPPQSPASANNPIMDNSPVHAANEPQTSAPAQEAGGLGDVGKDAAPQAANGAENSASESSLGSIGKEAGTGAENAATEATSSLGDAAGKVGEGATQLGDSASSGLGELGSTLGDSASGLGGEAASGLGDIAGAAGDGLAGAGADAAAGMGDMAAGLGAEAASMGAEAAGAAGAAAAGGEGALGLLGFLPLLFSDPKLKTGVGRKRFAFGGDDPEATSSVVEDQPSDVSPERKPIELVQVEKPKEDPVERAVQVADASGDWDKFKRQTLKFEGGYTPDDAGKGPSNYGINASANPGVDIRHLTPDAAMDIYRRKYWDSIGADQMPDSTRLLAADASVNQGPGRAREWAAQAGDDPNKLYHLRQAHYQHLIDSNPGKYSQYANAWNGRLNAVAQQAGVKDISNLQVNGHDARNPGMGPEYLDRSMSATTDGHEQEVGPGAGMGVLDVALPLAAAGLQYAANRGYYGSGPAAASAIASGLGTLGSMTQQGIANEHERQKMELERRKFLIEQEQADRVRKEYEIKERQRQEYEDAIRKGGSGSPAPTEFGPAPSPAPIAPPTQNPPSDAPPAPPPPDTSVTPNGQPQIQTNSPGGGGLDNVQPTAQPSGGGLDSVKTPVEQVVTPKVNEPPAVTPPAPTSVPPQTSTQNGLPDPARFWRGAQDASNPYFYQYQADKYKKDYDTFKSVPNEAGQVRAAAAKKAYDEMMVKAHEAATATEIPMKDGTTVPNPWMVRSKNQNAADLEQAKTDVTNRNTLEEIEPDAGGPKRVMTREQLLKKAGVDPNGVIKNQPEWVKETRAAQAKEEIKIPEQFEGRAISRARLQRMQDIMQTLRTGSFAEQKAKIFAALDGIGLPVDKSHLKTAADVEQFIKNGVANTFEQVKAMGGRPLVAEIEGLARANANPNLQPEANRQIVARSLGQLQYLDDYWTAYSDWRQANPYTVDTTSFEKAWRKDHDVKSYEDRAVKEATAVGSDNPPAKMSKDGVPSSLSEIQNSGNLQRKGDQYRDKSTGKIYDSSGREVRQ